MSQRSYLSRRHISFTKLCKFSSSYCFIIIFAFCTKKWVTLNCSCIRLKYSLCPKIFVLDLFRYGCTYFCTVCKLELHVVALVIPSACHYIAASSTAHVRSRPHDLIRPYLDKSRTRILGQRSTCQV